MSYDMFPPITFADLLRAAKRLRYYCHLCNQNTPHKLIDPFNGYGGWECCQCGARQLPGQPGPKP